MLLTDLADACRKSGLIVVELAGWRTNESPGGFDPQGVLCHHTGMYDALADPEDDLAYARWLAFTGRPAEGIPPPLCNLALSAQGVVYVCSAGNANHAGKAKASGPMPAASDGNQAYVGIEAMNNGRQGWAMVGVDAAGSPVTQGEAYARLCGALCRHYGWPADHVRAHRETSLTGKWDPGQLDMDQHRARVATVLQRMEDDDMAWTDELAKWSPEDDQEGDQMRAGQQLGQARGYANAAFQEAKQANARAERIEKALKALAAGLGDEVEKAVIEALADAVINVNVTVGKAPE